jgi:TonB family protein
MLALLARNIFSLILTASVALHVGLVFMSDNLVERPGIRVYSGRTSIHLRASAAQQESNSLEKQEDSSQDRMPLDSLTKMSELPSLVKSLSEISQPPLFRPKQIISIEVPRVDQHLSLQPFQQSRARALPHRRELSDLQSLARSVITERISVEIKRNTPNAPKPRISNADLKLIREPERIRVPPDSPQLVSKKAAVEATNSAASQLSVGAVDELPRAVLGNASPEYPAAILKAGVGGEVVLRVTISAQGHVVRLSLLRSSGVRGLDNSAMVAVRKWRFQPAIKKGKAVEFEVAVPIEFKALDSSR